MGKSCVILSVLIGICCVIYHTETAPAIKAYPGVYMLCSVVWCSVCMCVCAHSVVCVFMHMCGVCAFVSVHE